MHITSFVAGGVLQALEAARRGGGGAQHVAQGGPGCSCYRRLRTTPRPGSPLR